MSDDKAGESKESSEGRIDGWSPDPDLIASSSDIPGSRESPPDAMNVILTSREKKN
jgi:hypothetical protein